MADITINAEQFADLGGILAGHRNSIRLTETNIPMTGTLHVELLDAEMNTVSEARIDLYGNVIGRPAPEGNFTRPEVHGVLA